MIKLSAPVGKITGNKRDDVKTIQKMLNKQLNCLNGYKPVAENGRIDSDTIEAIRIFQRMSGISHPEGIITPGGVTLKRMNQAKIRILNPSAACQIADEARIRESIIKRLDIVERAKWHAKNPATMPDHDWSYHSIAIHHAGNSFSCGVKGIDELRHAESIDMASFGQFSYHYALNCKGTIYEALDIRQKGSHVENGNTGVIGIVFLADFSLPGEADTYGPGVSNAAKNKGIKAAVGEFISVQKDKFDSKNDKPSEKQLQVAAKLVRTLIEFFPIKNLGGHREFAKTHGTSRACPGTYGMMIAAEMRRTFKLIAP